MDNSVLSICFILGAGEDTDPEDRHGWCPHQPIKMPESVIAHIEPGNLMLIFIVSLQDGYLSCHHC